MWCLRLTSHTDYYIVRVNYANRHYTVPRRAFIAGRTRLKEMERCERRNIHICLQASTGIISIVDTALADIRLSIIMRMSRARLYDWDENVPTEPLLVGVGRRTATVLYAVPPKKRPAFTRARVYNLTD